MPLGGGKFRKPYQRGPNPRDAMVRVEYAATIRVDRERLIGLVVDGGDGSIQWVPKACVGKIYYHNGSVTSIVHRNMRLVAIDLKRSWAQEQGLIGWKE